MFNQYELHKHSNELVVSVVRRMMSWSCSAGGRERVVQWNMTKGN